MTDYSNQGLLINIGVVCLGPKQRVLTWQNISPASGGQYAVQESDILLVFKAILLATTESTAYIDKPGLGCNYLPSFIHDNFSNAPRKVYQSDNALANGMKISDVATFITEGYLSWGIEGNDSQVFTGVVSYEPGTMPTIDQFDALITGATLLLNLWKMAYTKSYNIYKAIFEVLGNQELIASMGYNHERIIQYLLSKMFADNFTINNWFCGSNGYVIPEVLNEAAILLCWMFEYDPGKFVNLESLLGLVIVTGSDRFTITYHSDLGLCVTPVLFIECPWKND